MMIRVYCRLVSECLAGLVVLSIGVMTLSCSSTDIIVQSEWEKLVAIRGEANVFHVELIEDRYRSDAFGAHSHLKEIYNKYRLLFSADNIVLLKRIENHLEDSPEGEKAGLLRIYLTEGYRNRIVSEHIDELRSIQLVSVVTDEGDTVDYQDIPRILATASNRSRRERLFIARLSTIKRKNQVYRSIFSTQDSLLSLLGYNSTSAYLAESHRVNTDALSKLAHSFLDETDSLFFALFSEMAPRHAGIALKAFRGYDFPYLMRGNRYDRHFSTDSLLGILKRTLAALGIEFDSLTALTINMQSHPSRLRRAATYPVNVPSDIRLLVYPLGGLEDYTTFYHEIGHALHYLFTQERNFEYLYLGDNTVTEVYAFFWEYLLDDINYLRTNFTFNDADLRDYLRFRAFVKLVLVRSYCADFLFEQLLYSGHADPERAFAEIKEPVLGYIWSDVERESYYDRAEDFYSADYLRAWFLEASLREKLKADFGENYFSNEATGEYLKDLWQKGNRLSAEQFANAIGVKQISTTAFLRELTAMLRL